MASPAGRRLTEAHRRTQALLGVQTVERLRAVWPLLDPDDLDGTFERWLVAAVPVIQAQRSTSARLAASYLAAFKTLEVGVGTGQTAILQELAQVEAVTRSLLVTGPLSVKRAMTRGVNLNRAMEVASAASSAAGMRHALNGGRETIIQTVQADSDATGWQRVASGNACKFCNLLDGKFHYADTADFPAHDGCACSQEPVYNNARRVSELSRAARGL